MKTLLLLAVLSIASYGQTTIVAGSATDTYHTPAIACAFNSSSVATNAPCVYQYTDATLPIPTMLVGYAATPFDYNIPAPAGSCEVVISFEEPNQTTAGQRLFSVTVPGQAPVTLDLFSLAGLKMLYTMDVKNVPVTNGGIAIHFQPVANAAGTTKNAVVSKLVTQNCVPPPPLTLTCQLPITCAFNPATNTYTITDAGGSIAALSACPLVVANTINSAWTSTGSVYLAHKTATMPMDCIPGTDQLTVVVDPTVTANAPQEPEGIVGVYAINSPGFGASYIPCNNCMPQYVAGVIVFEQTTALTNLN